MHFDLYEGNRHVYAIFFGTRHWKGANTIKQAIWKVAPFGEFAFHGSHSSQLTLGLRSTDYTYLRDQLKSKFQRKGWVDIQEIEEFVGSDRTDYHIGQLRKHVLIPMEESGEIEIKECTRKKKKTYPARTRLRLK